MFCSRCGSPADTTAKFCWKCGQALGAAPAPVAAPPAPVQHAPAPPAAEAAAAPAPTLVATPPVPPPLSQAPPPPRPPPSPVQAPPRPYVAPQAPPQIPGKRYCEGNNPWVAALLSFLIPGLGQFYNSDFKKGGVMLGAAVLLVWTLIVPLGVWVWSMIDAYRVASRVDPLW